MASSVHIVISDRGWILERLAEELKQRLPYVSYDTAPDADAIIQYYMTYATYKGRMCPHEVGLFTHLEKHDAAAKKFYEVASGIDVCVAMSKATEGLLVGKSARTTVISPGVDLDRFSPRVRIGVVGRTYHTGRKGEDLVAAVQDVSGIEWVFTGEGWPGPSQFVAEENLPSFYRSLDYVLVPARIEGGPMCVIEALACGVEVIAPPVGWVPEFPHIEFKTGDAQDLRRVLLELVQKRQRLRESVNEFTWDNWAVRHHQLFLSLVDEKSLVRNSTTVATATDMRAVVAVHGVEMSESAGGPSIRAPLTARALKKVGVDATFAQSSTFDAEAVDVVHIFNVWEPDDCGLLIQKAKKAGKPVVLSSIFLDLTEHDIYTRSVPAIFAHGTDDRLILAGYEALRTNLRERRAEKSPSYEIMPNYYRRVRELINRADHVILLSEDERIKLRRIGAEPAANTSSIVYNPVVATNFTNASGDLFQQTFGVKDYVLMVGRLESRKNQLTLAYALRNLPYPVVFIGHSNDEAYLKLLKNISGPNVHFIGRLEPNSEMLASAFAGARVFCMPSWSEGAPLAALEAAAAGCRMILSDRSSEKEYFGDHAWYCDPADPLALRELVIQAFNEDRSIADRDALGEYIRFRYSWDSYIRGTRAAYEAALQRRISLVEKNTPRNRPTSGRVLIDLTTLAHRNGPPSGIARVEDRLAIELSDLLQDRLSFFLWNSHYMCFLEVPRDLLESGNVWQLRGQDAYAFLRQRESKVPFDQMHFESGDTVIVFGGAWIRNAKYVRDLQSLRKAFNIKLITTIYDVIQWKFMNWFPPGVGSEFAGNCKLLMSSSDRILTCSQKSKDDISEFSRLNKVALPPIDIIRLGDDAESIDPGAALQLDRIGSIVGGRSFILYVSAIDVRKNHKMLLDVWDYLLEKHGTKVPKLILVGSKGWGGEAVIDRLEASPTLRAAVHIVHGLNDLTLKWLYRHSMFTVYPSLYEGWGLPVAESLSLGKFCIAANAGSLPEIAPGLVEMIDPRDFVSWARCIERYILHPSLVEEKEQIVKVYKRYSWGETARFIEQKLDKTCSTVELTELSVGWAGSFGTQDDGVGAASLVDNIIIGGWASLEKSGRWTIGSSAALCFRLTTSKPVALSFYGFAYEPDGSGPQIVDVMLNDVIIAVWEVDKNPRWFSAPIKPDLLDYTGKAIFRLNIRNPRVPSEYDPESTDYRSLGVFAQHLMIEPIVALAPDLPAKNVSKDTWNSLVICSKQPEKKNKYLLLELQADTAGSCEINADGQSFTRLQFRPGRQTRVFRLEDLCGKSGSFAILTVRPIHNAKIEVLEVGLLSEVPSEIMRRFSNDGCSLERLTHVPWHGQPPKILLNQEVLVVQDTSVALGMAGGWFRPELTGTWSNGSPSSLCVSLPDINVGNLHIELALYPFPWVLASGERIDFEFLIGTALFKRSRWCTNEIWRPSFIVSAKEAIDEQGALRITVQGPAGVVAPDNCTDSRALSFMLIGFAVRIDREIELLPDSAIAMGETARGLLLDNWHRPEANMTWSPGGAASKLRLPRLLNTGETVSLAIYVEVYAELLAHGPCQLRFTVGDTEIAKEVRIKAGSEAVILRLQKELIEREAEDLVLSIEAPEGIVPNEIENTSDMRRLSFNIQALHYLLS